MNCILPTQKDAASNLGRFTFRWEEPDPEDRETVVRLTLYGVGDATRVVLWQGEFATQARLALHRSGWVDSFEKLRALIESSA